MTNRFDTLGLVMVALCLGLSVSVMAATAIALPQLFA